MTSDETAKTLAMAEAVLKQMDERFMAEAAKPRERLKPCIDLGTPQPPNLKTMKPRQKAEYVREHGLQAFKELVRTSYG